MKDSFDLYVERKERKKKEEKKRFEKKEICRSERDIDIEIYICEI